MFFSFTSSPMMMCSPTLYDGGNGHHGFFFFKHGCGGPVHSIGRKRRKTVHSVHFLGDEKKESFFYTYFFTIKKTPLFINTHSRRYNTV